MPWKRRMLAVLRDFGLYKYYIAKDASVPGVEKEGQPTAEEIGAQSELEGPGDAEPTRSNAEMPVIQIRLGERQSRILCGNRLIDSKVAWEH